MRRTLAIFLTIASVSLSSTSAHALVRVIRGGRIMLLPNGTSPQIDPILATIDESNAAVLSQRDAAEQKLVALGDPALDALRTAAHARSGIPLDAVSVAIFRLENNLTPQDLLRDWAKKKNPNDAPPRFSRVIANDLFKTFPHHLFYFATLANTRTVLALAADGKIQDISDDASLARFLKNELPEDPGTAARTRAVKAATALAMYRATDIAPLDNPQFDAGEKSATATIPSSETTVTTTLTFDADNHVATVITTTEKVAPPTAAPPTSTVPTTNP